MEDTTQKEVKAERIITNGQAEGRMAASVLSEGEYYHECLQGD